VDVSHERQVEGAMRAARDAFGSLDVVVNCAGLGSISPLPELTDEKWRLVHAVSLSGVFYGVKKAGVDMITRCGALELSSRGIRVVGIAPGLVETPSTQQQLSGYPRLLTGRQHEG
jgi:NAD(P)-dependent dehydrogenase (short-subunit alcohol dehydrogenase family)